MVSSCEVWCVNRFNRTPGSGQRSSKESGHDHTKSLGAKLLDEGLVETLVSALRRSSLVQTARWPSQRIAQPLTQSSSFDRLPPSWTRQGKTRQIRSAWCRSARRGGRADARGLKHAVRSEQLEASPRVDVSARGAEAMQSKVDVEDAV